MAICDVDRNTYRGIDKLTRRPGQALPSITHVAPYVADSAHSNTALSLSVAPNTHFSARKKLTCQYLSYALVQYAD